VGRFGAVCCLSIWPGRGFSAVEAVSASAAKDDEDQQSRHDAAQHLGLSNPASFVRFAGELDLSGRRASCWRVIRTSTPYVFRDPQRRLAGVQVRKSVSVW